MSQNMYCVSCGCGCLILPFNCVKEQNSKLRTIMIEEKPELLNYVNTFILIGSENQGVLGKECFDILCSEIKSAQDQANDYNAANPDNEDSEGEFWFYLPEIWRSMLEDTTFRNLYSAYLVYAYYLLDASSETTASGEVIEDQKDNKLISSEDARKKAQIQLAIATGYAKVFKECFIYPNIENLPCLQCFKKDLCSKCLKDPCCCYKKKTRFPRSTAL